MTAEPLPGVPFDVPLTELEGPLDSAALKACFELARRTPSAANLQPWRFHVLRSEAARRHVAAHALNALGLKSPNHRNEALAAVPVIVLSCLEVLRAKCRFGERGYSRYGVQDLAAATQALRYAAWQRGIASHWVREVDTDTLQLSLSYAPRLELHAVIAFGRVADPGRLERPPCLDMHHVVHWEQV